ncbi:MAG: hypothetical protein NTW41_05455 [Verrucomicrobia bacterium]|nr:hypothetical protein [Verrucomicrobiota bacterium]
MPTQVYSSTSGATSDGWYLQPNETITEYPSGLIKTTRLYIHPQKQNNGPSLNGNVFPKPEIRINDAGFSEAVVNIYTSAGSGSSNIASRVFPSKILKTGEAIKETVKLKTVEIDTPDGPGTIQVPYLFRETFSFIYLAEKVTKSLVQSSSSTYTPSIPSGGATIQVMQRPFAADPYGLAWIMTDYQATDYGDIQEIVYSYEAVGKLYLYVNNTGMQDLTPPTPP